MRPRPGPCDVAFGDAPIAKYHPRGPGLRLVKRYYYTCAGSPRGIGTREYIPPHRELNTTIPYPVYRIRGVALAVRGCRCRVAPDRFRLGLRRSAG